MPTHGSTQPADNVVNITLSVGQSKIGAGAIDCAGNEVCRLPEIVTPPTLPERYAATAQQIVAVVHEVGLQNVGYAGVSFPEMVPPPSRLIPDPENLPNEPNEIHDAIAVLVAAKLGTPLTVEVLHDAAAAVLGEVSPKGTLPGCPNCIFIVWGTGVASGIIHNGSLYWQDPIINLMTGEIGLQVIRQTDGSFVYWPSPEVPPRRAGELTLDRWLRGPELARRFVAQIEEDGRGHVLLALAGTTVDELDLVDVNRVARQGDALAIELIVSAGWEMGHALAPFVHYWLVERGMTFVENIIIGSGVAKLGDGLQRDGKGTLVTAIRQALDNGLKVRGIVDYDTSKVILSAIGYEREFYAFMPST